MKKFLLLFIGFFFVISIKMIYVQSCSAESPKNSSSLKEIETSSRARIDTFITSENPDANYKDWIYLKVGNKEGTFESFFYFHFEDKPAEWDRVEISIYIFDFTEPISLNVCLIEESWNEEQICWNDHPDHGEELGNIEITEEQIYKFDITEYVDGRDYLCICIYYDGDGEETAKIASNESYQVYSEKYPRIIWIKEEKYGFEITNPTEGELVELGIYKIRWKSYLLCENVEIKLLKGGSSIATIASLTPNDGVYEWTLTQLNGYQGDNFQIRITSIEHRQVYEESETFLISDSGGKSIPSFNPLLVLLGIGIGIIQASIKKENRAKKET